MRFVDGLSEEQREALLVAAQHLRTNQPRPDVAQKLIAAFERKPVEFEAWVHVKLLEASTGEGEWEGKWSIFGYDPQIQDFAKVRITEIL